MLKSSGASAIRLRGVRQNNLKNLNLDLPLKKLIVITGLSGSGKSSLAFDTLFAEGQRRYIETFSPYARQFFDRMDKPQADSIEGIPPAIAIEQRNAVRTTRSTVGTMTEICEYMKTLWAQIAQLHCRQCGQPVRKDSPQQIWKTVGTRSAERGARNMGQAAGTMENGNQTELLVTFELPLSEKLSFEESLALIAKQGYQRLLLAGRIVRLDEVASTKRTAVTRLSSLTVVQDRLRLVSSNRARFIEACEQAYHFGKGKLALREFVGPEQTLGAPCHFSNRLHCAACDIEYRDPSPALFSFNHPLGACPTCRGFGRIISIDYNLALPDRSKSVAGGVVRPWQTGHGLESQRDLLRACRHFDIPTDVPFDKLPRKWQQFILEGEPDYGTDEEHEWPRAWYGVKGYFRWLESKAYKMHVRVLLSRYRAYTTCPDCQGKRFQPDALLYRVAQATLGGHGQEFRGNVQSQGPALRQSADATAVSGSANGANSLTLSDFYQLAIRDALGFMKELERGRTNRPHDALGLLVSAVSSRLRFLDEVGLGYLTLDRPTRSLSGGETERVNLTTCLGTGLVNTLFVLDEPSVGLHPRDTERLVRILQQLRQAGNTVLVVEHEASVMRAADQILDLGPGHGATGGQVVFQGTYARILRARASLTGQYLSGQKQIEIPLRRPVSVMQSGSRKQTEERFESNSLVLRDAAFPIGDQSRTCPCLILRHATKHNLKDFSVEIPLQRFVCITGVSGSGKTTLAREILLPLLQEKLGTERFDQKASDRLNAEEDSEGSEAAPVMRGAPILEGWEALGRVVMVDQAILAKTPRSNPAVYVGAFDDIRDFFAQSATARQRGLNASAFSFNSSQGQCERCRGAGYEKIEMQFLSDVFIRCPECNGRRYRKHILEVKVQSPNSKGGAFSIADLLDATVEEAVDFLAQFPESRPAQRAIASLKLVAEVGLGYLKLGQPINTLSGGESQRLKLVRHLAEAEVGDSHMGIKGLVGRRSPQPAFAGSSPPPPVAVCRSGPVSRITPRAEDGGLGTASLGPRTLFLFDEPTTGLHFDDVRVLLKIFQRLVNAGHSVLVIEHNVDVIKSADWVIDLGPEAGEQGGKLVAAGTPEDIVSCTESHTGKALGPVVDARVTCA